MKTVDFKFDIDEDVKTPFGTNGIIQMLGVDDGGIIYYVKTETNSEWFKEKQISVK